MAGDPTDRAIHPVARRPQPTCHTAGVLLAVAATSLLWAIVVTTFFALPAGLSLWALLDIAHRPQWAWAMTRHRQVVWLTAVLLGTLLLIVGVAVSLWYLLRIRPVVAAAELGEVESR